MFLAAPPEDADTRGLQELDRRQLGYVMNTTRVWSWHPAALRGYLGFRGGVLEGATLMPRELAVLVCATAAAREDSYCALAWGRRLAEASNAQAAADIVAGRLSRELTRRENALAHWAHLVVRYPNDIEPADVNELRGAGFAEREIFDATAFVAARLAFSTVNAALGARPDRELVAQVPEAVLAAVTYGRDPEPDPIERTRDLLEPQ